MDWVLKLELPLGVWAPISQCCVTLLRVFQAHLLLKDFRWTSDTGVTFLVGKYPGVYFYLVGVTLLLAVLLLYVLTYEWKEWIRGMAIDLDFLPSSSTNFSRTMSHGLTQDLSQFGRAITWHLSMEYQEAAETGSLSHFWWQWLLLPFCFGFYVMGVTRPLYHYSICLPDVQWLNGESAIQEFRNSTSQPTSQSCMGSTMGFVDSITWLYDNHMPFSALLAAYRSLIGPPLEFVALLALFVKPMTETIPNPVLRAMRGWLVGGAASKFATNCMVCILYVTIIQTADPGSNNFRAQFTRGFTYMMLYCTTYGFIVRSLDVEDTSALQEREMSSLVPVQEENSDSDEEEECRARINIILYILGAVSLFTVVGLAMYCSITTSFISLDFRYSSTTVLHFQPILFDLWQTLVEVNLPVALFAAATLVFFLLLRIILWLLLRTVCRRRTKDSTWSVPNLLSYAESFAKEFTLCHIWAESIILLWLGILTRNKDVYQVCARLPSPPIGLIAIAVLGIGVTSIHHIFTRIKSSFTWTPMPPGRSLGDLPGGRWLWGLGPPLLFCFWAVIAHMSSPAHTPKTMTRATVNGVLEGLLPAANRRIRSSIPESKGKCDSLWKRYPHEHADCDGRAPLAHLVTERGWDVNVLWATGLNKVIITEMKVEEPVTLPQDNEAQRWDLTLSGVFTDLRVWVQAAKAGEEWINDNICCDKNFTFAVQASTTCDQNDGFNAIRLKMLRMDHAEMESTVAEWDDPGYSGMIKVDYGDAEDVGNFDLMTVIQNYLSGKVGGGRLLMRTEIGSLDVLDFLTERLQDVVRWNTHPNRLCPASPIMSPSSAEKGGPGAAVLAAAGKERAGKMEDAGHGGR